MLCTLGSLHANRDKIIKHIKFLCWSNNVEAGNAVFNMTRSVFLLLAGTMIEGTHKEPLGRKATLDQPTTELNRSENQP